MVYLQKPKAGKLKYPRGDVDNYAKLVLDACNGLFYVDDSQIHTLTASKSYDDGRERIELEIEEDSV